MGRLAQFNVAKVLLACCIFLSFHTNMPSTHASSIPIWENFPPKEKMSFLYSYFAQLLSIHCKATTTITEVNKCKRDLLNYGYDKLQSFTNRELEDLNPFQRRAPELIWSTIMKDHPSSTLVTTRDPLPTPPSSSIAILTQQQPHTNTAADSQYPKNPMFDSDENKHQHSMDMDIAYGHPSMEHNPEIDVFDSNGPKTYLTGPSVVRVKIDGSPVEEDKDKEPVKDDDLETYASLLYIPRDKENQEKYHKVASINEWKQHYLDTLDRQ